MKNKIILLVAVLIAAGALFAYGKAKTTPAVKESIKIGIVTDLTGSAAYWGESSLLGASLAIKELDRDGYNASIVVEDYHLDPAKAISATQKLISLDKVDALYVEFNPAAIAIGSFIKGKPTLFLYDAAPVSPLEGNPFAFKTYLDFKEGCKGLAENFKNDGIKKIGVVKMNLEPGDLCLEGVKNVYGDDIVLDTYNLGDTDLRTQFAKMKGNKVEAIVSIGFEGDTVNALKAMRDIKYVAKYGTASDTVSDSTRKQYAKELSGDYGFGFYSVDDSFKQKISTELSDGKATNYYAAALAYTHIRQIVKVLAKCNKDAVCAALEMGKIGEDKTVGFEKFQDRSAVLRIKIEKY